MLHDSCTGLAKTIYLYAPYMSVYMMISLPNIPYVHRIYLQMYRSGQPTHGIWLMLHDLCIGLARTVYICTVYVCIFGDFSAKNIVYTPYIGSGQLCTCLHLPGLYATSKKSCLERGVLVHADTRLVVHHCKTAPLLPSFLPCSAPEIGTSSAASARQHRKYSGYCPDILSCICKAAQKVLRLLPWHPQLHLQGSTKGTQVTALTSSAASARHHRKHSGYCPDILSCICKATQKVLRLLPWHKGCAVSGGTVAMRRGGFKPCLHHRVCCRQGHIHYAEMQGEKNKPLLALNCRPAWIWFIQQHTQATRGRFRTLPFAIWSYTRHKPLTGRHRLLRPVSIQERGCMPIYIMGLDAQQMSTQLTI